MDKTDLKHVFHVVFHNASIVSSYLKRVNRRFGTYWKNIKKASGYEEPTEKQKESGYWIKQENRRAFFDDLGKKLGIRSFEDWYSVDAKDVIKNKGARIFQTLGPSLGNVLPKIYPEYNWHPWKFNRVYVRFWDDLHQVRKYLQYLGEKLGIKQLDDWYDVKKSDLLQIASNEFTDLTKHKITKSPQSEEQWTTVHDLIIQFGSLSNALIQAFPEHVWEISKFQKVQQGYWKDHTNHRKFLEDIASDLGVKTWTDWYSVTREEIVNRGAWGLLSNYYSGSLSKAVTTLFPQHPWEPWRFSQKPKGSWKDKDNVLSFLENAKLELQIKDHEDWLAIPYSQLTNMGFKTLLQQYGGLIPLLKKFYTDYDWDNALNKLTVSSDENGSLPKERMVPSKTQNVLFKFIYSLFPSHIIHSDFPHPKLRYADSNLPIQFDIFIPSLSIAFEYQGAQHYIPHYLFTDKIGSLLSRDEEKRKACALAGITLYEVPYWWNLSKDALVGTILKQRPDLIHQMKYTPSSEINDARTNSAISIPQVLLNEPEKFPQLLK